MKISSVRVCVSGEASDIPTIGEEIEFTFDGEKFHMEVTGVEAFSIGSDDYSGTIVLCPKMS